MNREYLLKKAKAIKNVSENSRKELDTNKELLVGEMNKKMLAREDLMEMIGEKNLEMMKDNHSNHFKFMMSMFLDYQAEVYVNTIAWVFRAYRSRGFKTTYWAAQLNSWIEIFKENLSNKTLKEVQPYYEFIIVHIPDFVTLSEQESEIQYTEL